MHIYNYKVNPSPLFFILIEFYIKVNQWNFVDTILRSFLVEESLHLVYITRVIVPVNFFSWKLDYITIEYTLRKIKKTDIFCDLVETFRIELSPFYRRRLGQQFFFRIHISGADYGRCLIFTIQYSGYVSICWLILGWSDSVFI